MPYLTRRTFVVEVGSNFIWVAGGLSDPAVGSKKNKCISCQSIRFKTHIYFKDSPERSSTLVYNKAQDKWDSTNAPTLPIGLKELNIVPINRKKTKLLISGGKSGASIQDVAYVYHWHTKRWTDVGPLADGPRQSHRSIFFKADKEENDKVLFLKNNKRLYFYHLSKGIHCGRQRKQWNKGHC